MIHHYTSIQNLALILRYKTIRFSRLDTLDDITEISGLQRKFGTYVYVSCWTEDENENIALWNMYTNMKGVRISIPKDMFKKYYIQKGDYGNFGYTEDFTSPLSIEKLRTDDYFITNAFWLEDGFYKKIIYDEKYMEINKNLFHEHDGNLSIDGIQNLGRYKDIAWEFQKESRFTLMAIPLLPLNHPLIENNREKQMIQVTKSLFLDIENNFKYIDLDLDDDVLNNILIKLAPTCNESDEIIVDSLLKKFTTNGSFLYSSLKGNIRRNK